MVKGLTVKDMNRNAKNTSIRVRHFPGATVKQQRQYVIATLTDDTPNTIIIQGIAIAIGSLGNLCRSHGVNQVLISPPIY